MKQRLVLLGSTGSIGVQTLDIARENPDLFEVRVLTAHRNWELLAAQAREFDADAVVIADKECYTPLREALADTDIKVYAGEEAVEQVAGAGDTDVAVNALVGYDRAIVTDVAGTTRDTVEEKATAGGVLLRLIDTAGIRDASDPVERLGVERARRAAAEAELALLVLDGSRPLTEEDREVIRTARAVPRVIAVQNKADLPRQWDTASLEAELGTVLSLSAREGQGLEALEAAIARLFPEDGTPRGEILTNARQAESLSRALASLRGARAALEDGLTPDAVLSDVERAMNALGEVTGQTLREDLTARIFERFCVGK